MSQPDRDNDLLQELLGRWDGSPGEDRIRTWREILGEVAAAFAGRDSGERSRFTGGMLGQLRFDSDEERREVLRITRMAREQGDLDDPGEDDDDLDDGRPLSTKELKKRRGEAKAQRSATLEEFNARYAVVREGGAALVFDDCYDDVLKRRYYDRLKPATLFGLYAPRKVCTRVDVAGKRHLQPAAKWWWEHDQRREYVNGVVFVPGGEAKPGFLNLWSGFGFEPRPGCWDKTKLHIRDVVCAGNIACYEYLMNWNAKLVQQPGVHAGVTVVMRGEPRIGKGLLGHALRRLFGQHGIHVASSQHLVGNFNLHLRDCVLLFADEAFFAGDKANESKLKAIITEDVIEIEGKYMNTVQAPNMLHVIMASNNDWVVPVAIGEERFFVLDVLSTYKGDREYFRAIFGELENGGYEAMLHELLNRDISNFDVRNFPHTGALMDQKQRSLGTTFAWLREVLERGYVFKSRLGLEDKLHVWMDPVPVPLLYESYRAYAKECGERHPLHQGGLVQFLSDKMGWEVVRPRQDHPRPDIPQTGIVGEHVVGKEAAVVRKNRPRCCKIGTLAAAAERFEAVTGLSVDAAVEDEVTVDNVVSYRPASGNQSSDGADMDIPF